MLQLHFKNAKLKPIWLVEPEYSIGSASTNGLHINDASLEAKHGKLMLADNSATLVNLMGDAMIRVNGVPVHGSRELRHGDILNFGYTELTLLDSRINQTKTPVNAVNSVGSESEQPWRLTPVGTALAGREFSIAKEAILGRAKECDISLAVAHLSRKHARLSVSERGLVIEDLKSANGTYVNGQKISKAVLKPGDQVRFDSLTFQVSGPQVDLESTTVRPILKVADLKVRQAGVANKETASGGGTVEPQLKARSPSMASHSGASAVVTNPEQQMAASSGKSSSLGMWFVILVVIAAGGWFFLQSAS